MMDVGPHFDIKALQDAFVAALREPQAPVPEGLIAPRPEHLTRRFNVYRNTVHASLAAALAARFPVIVRLVGDEFFGALAREFIDRAPPSSPVLHQYGAAFPGFLAGFEPVADLPYLGDVAGLEWARTRAYHARDAGVIEISALSTVAAEALGEVRLVAHPSASAIRSEFPIVSIWSTNTHDDEVRSIGPECGAEAALVARPHLQVLVTPISAGTADLYFALASGATLGEAFAFVAEREPEFPVGQGLAELFVGGAFEAISV